MPDDAPPTTPVIELPAAPRELRPSPLGAAAATLDGVIDDLGDRAKTASTALASRASETVGGATDEVLAHVRREGAWRTAVRVVAAVGALALCFRLAFDDALPRLVLGLGGAALGALAVMAGAHAWSLGRRRRSMLDAMELLARIGREHPETLPALTPQLAKLVDALRAEDPRWPPLGNDDALLRALAAPGNSARDERRSD